MTKLSNQIAYFLCFTSCIGFAVSARADTEYRGEISTAGSPAKRRTILTPEDGHSPIVVCQGGKKYSLGQLPGSIVTARGEMKKTSSDPGACLLVESFEINEIVKGRPAIVGQLKKLEKNTFAIVSLSGRTWKLSRIPPGMQSLINTTVVGDLVADSAASGETTWLVARVFIKP
jgi:hypothetical protein